MAHKKYHNLFFLIVALFIRDVLSGKSKKPVKDENLEIGFLGSFQGVSLHYLPDVFQSLNRNSIYAFQNNFDSQVSILTSELKGNPRISDICRIDSQLFIAGEFESIGNISKSSLFAIYDLELSQWKAPKQSLQGKSVNALLCDSEAKVVYIGGDFSFDNKLANAVKYTVSKDLIELPEFGGFDAKVTSIARSSNSSIIFGGSFTSTNKKDTTKSKRQISSSSEALNKQELYDLSLSTVSLFNSKVSLSSIVLDESTQSDSQGLNGSCLCPGSSLQLQKEESSGIINVQTEYSFWPAIIRIYLDATKISAVDHQSFHIRMASGGILNLTYSDDAGKQHSCTEYCPLNTNKTISYQEFQFVNPVWINEFSMHLQQIPGQDFHLNGLQLYTDENIVAALDTMNQGCNKSTQNNVTFHSDVKWEYRSFPESNYPYMQTYLSRGQQENTFIEFLPHIKTAGKYSIRIDTPGCSIDGSCSRRGNFDALIYYSEDESPSSYSITTNNEAWKYDTVFEGDIQMPSESFKPRVILKPTNNQDDDTLFVAQGVHFLLLEPHAEQKRNKIKLNGIFEYNLKVKDEGISGRNTTIIESITTAKNIESVSSISSIDEYLLFAGQTNTSKNFLYSFDYAKKKVDTQELNGRIDKIFTMDKMAIICGNFELNKANHVAIYEPATSKLVSLSGGPRENVTEFSMFNETTILAIGNSAESTMALNLKSLKWESFSNLTGKKFLNGAIGYSFPINSSHSLISGNFNAIEEFKAEGAIQIEKNKDLISFPGIYFDFKSSHNQKMLMASYDSHDNLVIGGRFDISNASNLIVFRDRKPIINLGQYLTKDSIVYSTEFGYDGSLFAGGTLKNSDETKKIEGIARFKSDFKGLFEVQPSALHKISKQITGDFNMAGSLDCNAVCLYSITSEQWINIHNGLISGQGFGIAEINEEKILVFGDLKFKNESQYGLIYDFNQRVWTPLDIAKNALPHPPTQAVVVDEETILFAGTLGYVVEWKNKKVSSLLDINTFGTESRVIDIEFTDSKNSTLLAVGSFNVTSEGIYGAAVLDYSKYKSNQTTTWKPFLHLSAPSVGESMVYEIFNSKNLKMHRSKTPIKKGYVVLIGLAISLFITLSFILLAVVIAYIFKRKQKYVRVPTGYVDEFEKIPPEQVIGEIGRLYRNNAVPQI